MKIRYTCAGLFVAADFLERTIPVCWWNIRSSVVVPVVGRKGLAKQQHPSKHDGGQIHSYVLCSFSTSVQNKIVIQMFLIRRKNNACL